MLVGIYQTKSINWLLSDAEEKCWLCHLPYDMLENINYLGENEVFLLWYSFVLSHKPTSTFISYALWFLPCGIRLLPFALWDDSRQKSLDGANHSLVNFQPSQINPLFMTKSHILWSVFTKDRSVPALFTTFFNCKIFTTEEVIQILCNFIVYILRFSPCVYHY